MSSLKLFASVVITGLVAGGTSFLGVQPAQALPETTPQVLTVNPGVSAEVGTKFTASAPVTITGMKFYKSTTNKSTIGSLWDPATKRRITTTIYPANATGWIEAKFSKPVVAKAGQSFVVSSFLPKGGYSETPGFFSTPKTEGPISYPVSAGMNNSKGGVYPDQATKSNYAIDVTYEGQSSTPAPAPTPVAAPVIAATAATEDTISLAWDSSVIPTATEYTVQYGPADHPTENTKTVIASDGNGYTLAGLTANTSYVIKVFPTVTPANATTVTVKTEATAPVTPEPQPVPVISASSSTQNSVSLAWKSTDITAGTEYTIKYGKASNPVAFTKTVVASSGNGVTLQDLEANTSYTFKVYPTETPSNSTTVTVITAAEQGETAPAPIATPVVTGTSTTDNSASFSWTSSKISAGTEYTLAYGKVGQPLAEKKLVDASAGNGATLQGLDDNSSYNVRIFPTATPANNVLINVNTKTLAEAPAPAPENPSKVPVEVAVFGDSNSTGHTGSLETGVATGEAYSVQNNGFMKLVGGWARDGANSSLMLEQAKPVAGADVAVIMAGTNNDVSNLNVAALESDLKGISQKSGAPNTLILALAPWDAKRAEVTAANVQLKAIADRNNWEYLDPWTELRTPENRWVSAYYKDGIHTTKAGYGVMGHAVERYVLKQYAGFTVPNN
jgi:lysophospholipase L1-like esterase